MTKLLFSALLLCALPLAAQDAPSSNPNPAPSARSARRPAVEPCWQQAGIEKSAMEQIWSIQRETRTQVEGVCANSSLTPEEKHQQLKEIHQQAHEKMDGIITADQQKAMTACQQERRENHPAGARAGGGTATAGDGCGDWQRGPRNPNNANPNGDSDTPPDHQPAPPQN
jgi:Spy/CpxP family protein refolding chaperone